MNQQTMQAPSLFDLLSRQWRRPSPISGLCFSADGAALAVAAEDGSIAIAATADREPPESRIRVSADVGRTTISPREHPPVPLIATGATAQGHVPLVAFGRSEFLVGARTGDVLRLKADGEDAGPLMTLGGVVTAIDHCPLTGVTAAADGTDVHVSRGFGAAVPLGHGAALRVAALAFSPDGGTLGCSRDDGLSLWKVGEAAVRVRDIAFSDRPDRLRWSGDGAWLACALERGGFGLVGVSDGLSGIVAGYPSPVRSLCWSAAADTVTLVTSGAFRVAGWSMRPPPFGGDISGALETGRAGVVLVETVAAHPVKKLVAAGYANGQIVIAEIGGRDELLVRPSGGAVTALAWSGDGRHLAAGAADGTAAIITFPAQMFK